MPLRAKMPIDPELARLVDEGAIEQFEDKWLHEAEAALLQK